MKIREISVDGIGGINHLDLKFNEGVNVICGANGIGKTTILDIIADAFSFNIASKLKRNALWAEGKYKIKITNNSNIESQEIKVTDFQPDKDSYRGMWKRYSRDLLFFGINRSIKYAKLPAVSPDPERKENITGSMATTGISANDIKNWFVNRYLFEDKENSLTKKQIRNYQLAKNAFGILDESVCFKTVNAHSFDIMLSTHKGDIYFEYLSSGYKSCIYILLGIIKEIEFRYYETPICVSEFDGVVLIDEVDLHLHPIWQAKLVSALKTLFPNVQFILTTHSPSILQSLETNEIIALGSDEKGNTILKELNLGRYGLQGWTLEEILKYIMEMPTTTSKLYKETLSKFDDAMNDEDKESILEQYSLLKEMLHPENPLRKLLAIQVAEWEE